MASGRTGFILSEEKDFRKKKFNCDIRKDSGCPRVFCAWLVSFIR